MKFQWTIGRKLVGLSVLALAFLGAVAATGYLAATGLARATAEILQDGAAIKHQMQADQAHDAMRADVLAALQRRSSGSWTNTRTSSRCRCSSWT
jgi:methyl-accepting chemotaxis protein